jgi:hypothetical protein
VNCKLLLIFTAKFIIMKRNEGKYQVVNKLPKTAQLVKDYAKVQNVLESAIYNRYSRALKDGKPLPFKLVIYFERNFIIP